VSGYLERLVSRHAGPPAVRARVVSRFEGDLVGRSVSADPWAPDGPPSATATAGSIEVSAAPQPVSDAAITVPTGPATGRPVGATARDGIEASRPTRRATPSLPSPATDPPRPERTDGPPGPAHHDVLAGTRSHEISTVVPVTIRRADPPAIGTPADGRAALSRRSATAMPSEPDVVHVHIGRVEVRATIPAPEPSRPAPRPARPAPLSLERYLSGERRT
jgi:hypothetical protein